MIKKLKIVNHKSVRRQDWLKISTKQAGFTLVEIIVAVTLFTLVASISLGAIMTIFDANRRAQAAKTVVDNLNLSLEDMVRTVRFGSNYFCGISSNINSVNNCSLGGESLSVTFNGNRIIYRLNGVTIQRSDNGGLTYTNITSPETTIENLRFYVFGSAPLDEFQSYAVVFIRGHVGNKPTLQSRFDIQTVMSQRRLDI